MKTLHVGGLNPIRRYKTFTDAIEHASDDDTIELHKDIAETVTIDKNIIIKGNNHGFSVPQGKVGINALKELEIFDLHFVVNTRANALVTEHDISLTNVSVKLVGPIREFYPVIMVTAKMDDNNNIVTKPNVLIENCSMLKLLIGDGVKSNIINTKFTSYYKGDIMLGTREDMSSLNGDITITDSELKSVIIYGDATIKNTVLHKYVDIEGNTEMFDVVLNPNIEGVKKNEYKKEPTNGPLSNDTHSKYVIAARTDSELTIEGYTVDNASDGFFGLYATNAVVKVSNVNNDSHLIGHLLKGSTVSFLDTKDQNYWDIQNTTTAYVRSTINSNSEHITAKEKLDNLIGQQTVKDQVNSIMNTIEMNRESNDKDFSFSNNMIFAGNPGTGKSTIARIVAESLFEVGAIPQNKFTTATSDEFVKGYIGQTGENTRKILDNALGGVLFIDEAYELTVRNDERSFNSEVISVLIRYMEEHRDDLVVIAAGYNKEMKEFLSSNVGLARRFQWIQFEDYTNSEMAKIFETIRHSYGDEYAKPELSAIIEPLFERVTALNMSIPDANGRVNNGGNGGLVRNVYQQIVQARNNRYINSGGTRSLTQEDIAIGFKAEMEKARLRAL